MSSVKEIYNLRNYAYVFAIKATLYPEWFFFFFPLKESTTQALLLY